MARNTSFDLVNTKINDKFSTYFSGFILGIFTIILYTRPFQMYVIFYFLFFFSPPNPNKPKASETTTSHCREKKAFG